MIYNVNDEGESRSMNLISRREVLKVIAVAILAQQAWSAGAQEAFPSRPLRLVVPFPPGALTDVLGRAVGERLARALGQPVVVDNKPGAGTLIGAEFVAKSPADGYTLLISTSTTFGIAPALYKSPQIDPTRDFQPLSLLGTVNFFLIATPTFPAKTMREMIDAVKADPGKYNYASVGNGSAHHLFMEDLKRRFGLDLQHVPYKGTGAAIADLMSGKIQVMFCDATLAVPNIQAGKVKTYGTSAAKQNALIASVAPIAQTVPGFDWQAWQGVSAPAATPPAVIARLSGELQKFQQTAEFREFLVRIGMDPSPAISPAEFGEFVRLEMRRWAEAVRVSGAKLD